MNTIQRRSFWVIVWLFVMSGVVLWVVGGIRPNSASANAASLIASDLDTTTKPHIISTSQFGSDTTTEHYSNESSPRRNTPEGTFNAVWVSNDTDATRSVTWGDMDGDGDLDILAGNNGQVNKVYRNDGNGTFTDVTAGDLASDTANTSSVAWGDMDGDGDLDILAGNNGQVNKVYRNDGNGTFTDITAGDLASDADSTLSVVWGIWMETVTSTFSLGTITRSTRSIAMTAMGYLLTSLLAI